MHRTILIDWVIGLYFAKRPVERITSVYRTRTNQLREIHLIERLLNLIDNYTRRKCHDIMRACWKVVELFLCSRPYMDSQKVIARIFQLSENGTLSIHKTPDCISVFWQESLNVHRTWHVPCSIHRIFRLHCDHRDDFISTWTVPPPRHTKTATL